VEIIQFQIKIYLVITILISFSDIRIIYIDLSKKIIQDSIEKQLISLIEHELNMKNGRSTITFCRKLLIV